VVADYTVPAHRDDVPAEPALIDNIYTHGPGVDEPLVWWRRETTTTGSDSYKPALLMADGLGSITGITGSASDTLTAKQGLIGSYTYDSFGNTVEMCNATVTTSMGSKLLLTFLNRYRYTSREWFDTDLDPSSQVGVYYYLHRTGDPYLGRFYQEDPEWDTNLYYYVKNAPTYNVIHSEIQ